MRKKEYESIAEFFYKKASARIKKAVEESGLNHVDIFRPDPKQISRIVNNNRQRNNPFLINDSVLDTSYENDETGDKISCGLIHNLNFASKKDILWGTENEIQSYIYELFLLLWNEVCINRKLIDSEMYLCDYVPYAKYRTYWRILFEPDTIKDPDTLNDPRFSFIKCGKPAQASAPRPPKYKNLSEDEYNNRMFNFPAIFFCIKEDTVIENIGSAKEEAFEFFYENCKEDFLAVFSEFAKKNESFHMLNNIIRDDLVKKRFLPLMEKYKPNTSSLGFRVEKLIYDDLSYSAALICNHNIDNISYRKSLIKASSEYIYQLEKIQLSQIKRT